MKDHDDFQYALRIPPERLEFYAKLTPEERLQWLEEAHEFVSEAVPYETVKRWRDFIKGGYGMEKAKIEVTKTKKGTFVGTLVLSDGKKIPVSDLKLTNATLNGKEVEVQREKGQVIKIACEGVVVYEKGAPKQQPNPSQGHNRRKNTQNQDIYSQAPYNFIPLNSKVIKAEEVPEFDRYYEDRYTGYIDLEIKALTPLYVRDTLTEEEYRKKLALERQSRGEDKRQFINPDFFSPGGFLRIPGSSIRGMIRTMIEIMSFGKFGFFEDARLYYRGLADVSSLRKEYQRNISSFDRESGRTQYKMSAGILRKKGLEYFITQSKGYRQILKTDARQMIERSGKQYEEFSFYKIDNGYIVVSGSMQNKKRDWLIEIPVKDAPTFKVPAEDIENYRNDKNRSGKVPDLLNLAKDGVPCFYVRYADTNGKNRIAFGHTGMFRLAYEKTIGDHIPSALKDPNTVDLVEAIFGNKKTHAGRVFFEDAYLEGDPKDALLDPAIPKILSGPKPTCFQHYLEQNEQESGNLKEHPKNLAHYNSDNPIRGYKLYWHRSGEGWIETNKENIKSHQSQYTCITPVRTGSVFNGRIRFENLSKVELGALLFALDLPHGLAHKIGMGKPLGLGSVRLTPRLYLSDRKQRYLDLFAEFSGLNDESAKITDFKKDFESYVINQIGLNNVSSLWDGSTTEVLQRMLELKKMLDYVHKPADEKTDYLELSEFKKRKVLQAPTKI